MTEAAAGASGSVPGKLPPPEEATAPSGSPSPASVLPSVPAAGRTTRRLILILSSIAAFMALLLVVRSLALTPYRIATSSMEPILLGESPQHPGDTIVVNRLAYLGSGPARWEVVAFRPLETPAAGEQESPPIVKRVVGLPGEKVEIRGGEVYVNGKLEPKPPGLADIHYIASGSFGWSPLDLGPGEYFVLGDNSYLSLDSRRFGPLPLRNIFGRVSWIIWPSSRMGGVR